MKRIAFSVLAAVALAAPAQAIVGGPFDNNQFYDHSLGGTYQGTLTAKNISATMFFGTSAEGGNTDAGNGGNTMGNGGYFAAFIDGRIVLGRVATSIDGASDKLAGVLMGRTSQFVDPNGQVFYASPLDGFFNASLDKKFPNITYKGKAKLTAFIDGDFKNLNGRVRGIKSSSNSSFLWEWFPATE